MMAREVLLKAAGYIDKHGLRKDGKRGISGEPCSIVGAMDVVSGHNSDAARRAFMRHLGKAVAGLRHMNGLVIDTWGSAAARTPAEVSAELRAAAKGAP